MMMTSEFSIRQHLLTLPIALSAGILLFQPVAFAQSVLERNLPQVAPGEPVSLGVDEQEFGATDTTPLGVDLAGVYLIGEDDAAAAAPPKGVGGKIEIIDRQAAETALGAFIGEPLTLALAGRIQAAIARVYRDAGYPFVSVTLPPQEITSGVLQVRVIEFRTGDVTVEGVAPGEAEGIRKGLRAARGEKIDARALEEDLNWLNRTPYRRAEGVFRPGEDTALSNLDVMIRTQRPWQVFAGWSNSGSSDTGRDRYFLGGSARLPLPGAPWISYQMTASDDIWSDPGIIIPRGGDYPGYISHAGRLTIPTFARQSLEIAPALVASSDRPNRFFTIENTTFELPVIYRSAVSNILPGRYWGDIYGGVEFKRLERRTLFNGVSVAEGSAELFQLVLGWSGDFEDRWGKTVVDVRVKANPGGVLHGNDMASWHPFSNGRIDDLQYAYLAMDLTRATPLPAQLSWISSLSGTLAGEALPDTERVSLGGRYAVRGYNYDDVSVDSGIIWRNELRLPNISLLGDGVGGDWLPPVQDSLSPYFFADLGFGGDHSTDRSTTLGGLGVGFDYNVGETFSASFIAGVALSDGGNTQAGDWNLQGSITARF
ncbi:ShlB/FhaC/HecB family hemolysin secretion/activation protein [Nitratireductor aquimarinus]|nr:ShlB/FhaC/HecB family hemolysin secretion/activation protein [Nitratireductor aquimarinus]MBY6133811.1 ShlB/FhaC/HecB family hemolysin secretion/activation protein [Nitratireductor aquimarinus]